MRWFVHRCCVQVHFDYKPFRVLGGPSLSAP